MWVKPASDESFEGEKTGAPRSLKADFWGDSDWRLLEGDRDAMVGGIPSIHEDRECPRWGALVESRTSGEWPRDLQREKWRAHIRVGDVIDAKDSEGRWFDSRVVEVDRGNRREGVVVCSYSQGGRRETSPCAVYHAQRGELGGGGAVARDLFRTNM